MEEMKNKNVKIKNSHQPKIKMPRLNFYQNILENGSKKLYLNFFKLRYKWKNLMIPKFLFYFYTF